MPDIQDKQKVDEELVDETAPPAADAAGEDGWEELRTGLGREWDFERDGALTGYWTGISEVPVEAADRKTAKALTFATIPDGEVVFVWSSYELDNALEQAGVGDKLRIQFLGRDSFTGDDGPRQVKRYKVQRATS